MNSGKIRIKSRSVTYRESVSYKVALKKVLNWTSKGR